MPSSLVTSDKADSFDIGMVAYPIHCRDRTVYDIQHAIRQAYSNAPYQNLDRQREKIDSTCSLAELSYYHCSSRISLRRFENQCVACDSGERYRPQRDHRREVERRNAVPRR